MNLVETAEAIARKAHAGQFRRDGVTPYITHPERVVARLKAQGVADETTLAVAWLHDVFEDCPAFFSLLYATGLPSEVRTAVELLTHEKQQAYRLYLSFIVKSPVARAVKIADILDNLSDTPTPRQIVKYASALLYLCSEALPPPISQP